MRLTLIFRKPTPGQYSIEQVFQPLIPIFQKSFEVKCVYLPHTTSGIIKLIRNLIFIKKLERSDIYHITGDVQYVSIALPKNKTILTIHDFQSVNQGSRFNRVLKRFLWFDMPIKKVRIVTAISKFTFKELSQEFKSIRKKLHVVGNPVASNIKVKLNVLNDKFRLLQIGTKENKNLERLIRAIKDIDCQLVIVGKLTNRQVQLLSEYKVDYQNYYQISNEKIHELYASCDLTCFISTYEGFGMPVIESQVHGKPVITSDIPPIKEISGDSVRYVDPKNISMISEAIEDLIENKTLREELVKKGLFNAQRFAPEKIAGEYLDLYRIMMS